MADFNAFTVDDETVKLLESAGFLPVLRWVRPSRSERTLKTRDAIAEAKKATAPKKARAGTTPKRGDGT